MVSNREDEGRDMDFSSVMTAAGFINECDKRGGIVKAFESGIKPNELPPGKYSDLRQIVFEAYDSWQKLNAAEDRYYTLVETGRY